MINSLGSVNFNNTIASTSLTATAAKPQAKEVEFSYNPQDSIVMDPGTTTLSGVEHGKRGPSTERVALSDARLSPNSEGNYVFDKDNKNYSKAQTFATVAKTLDTFEKIGGTKIPWGFNDTQIQVKPDGGEDFNAYYSRDDQSLNFFHGLDPVTNQTVFSGNSGEVVSHEVGHALLDGMRPEYFSAWGADCNGFHEAFGDITALMMSTQDDHVCQLAAEQTGGDLKKPSLLSRTGEELGRAINNQAGRNATGGDYVRSLINDFKWQSPRTVPQHPSGTDPLTTEMHSWSRIFSGAQYDILATMVSDKMGQGMDAAAAIKDAGKDSIELLAHTMKYAPKAEASYRDIAMAMLKADSQDMGGKNHDAILNSFMNRNILFEGDDAASTKLSVMSAEPPVMQNVTVTLDGSEFGMFAGAEVSTKAEVGEMGIASSKADDLKADLKQMINNGSILYTEPNQKLESKDMFDKNGNPYLGVVRWTEGKMVIERTNIVA